MDIALEHDDEHYKQQKDLDEEDKDVEMVHKGMDESALGVCRNYGNEDEDDDEDENDYREESHLDLNSMGHTAPATSMPLTAAWSHSNPFSDPWAQPSSILSESNLSASRVQDPDTLTKFTADPDTTTTFSAEPDTPPKSPAEAFLDMSPPLIQGSEPQPDLQEEIGSSVPMESGILAPPAIGMSQSSTLSGTALSSHSSSETSTPEELRDYDSSSGVESRSDKQQTPVPAMQTDIEQDLGIHLERGDGEEEEAETLPADEVLGDAATAPASVPSSPSTSGDEASDTEGECKSMILMLQLMTMPQILTTSLPWRKMRRLLNTLERKMVIRLSQPTLWPPSGLTVLRPSPMPTLWLRAVERVQASLAWKMKSSFRKRPRILLSSRSSPCQQLPPTAMTCLAAQ